MCKIDSVTGVHRNDTFQGKIIKACVNFGAEVRMHNVDACVVLRKARKTVKVNID